MTSRVYNVVKSIAVVEKKSILGSCFNKLQMMVQRAPKAVDLRPQLSPIVDQGQLGSCTGNAIASGLREFLLIKQTKCKPTEVTRLSRLFVYYEERSMEGTINEDAGAAISDGMKIILNMGVAPEADEPYDVGTFTTAPSEKAIQDALQYKVANINNLKGYKEVKSCLASGYPIVIGMEVFASFESREVARTGVMPMPKHNEQNLGGHAVCVVGYDDTKGYFIVRNSWGEGWGDKGYFYMPYQYFIHHTWDYWTAR